MKNLTDSIADFTRTAKEFLPKAEFAIYNLEEITNLSEELVLSEDVIHWYTTAAPIDLYIPASGNEIELYDPINLRRNHNGYRWIPELNSRNLSEYTSESVYWNKNWLLIGDKGGDPIVAKVNKPNTPIFFAEHGQGKWEPKFLCSSLASFLSILSFWLQFTFQDVGKLDDFFDKDFNVLPDVYTDLVNKLAQFNSEEHIANIVQFLGVELT